MARTFRVYLCGVDYQHHLRGDSRGTRVYYSVESLKAQAACWRQCGIVALRVIPEPEWIEPQDFTKKVRALDAEPAGGTGEGA